MNKLQVINNEAAVKEVESGTDEATRLADKRTSQVDEIYKRFKDKNSNLVNRVINYSQNKLIGKSEIELIVKELESQKKEMDAIYTARVKALQKVMESKLMNMTTTLQVELSTSFKRQEIILISALNQSDVEFQEIIESFEARISSFKITEMKKRALDDLNMQVVRYYDTKEKLLNEYSNLIDKLKY